jgi:large subunit ribosomal protein L4
MIVEDFGFEAPKTKEFLNLLDNLNIRDKKSLIVLDESNKNVYLSSRNLKTAKVVNVSELNTYNIMNSNVLLISESRLEELQNNLNK